MSGPLSSPRPRVAGSFESAPGTMPPSETLFVLLAVGVPLVLVTIRTWGLPGADFLDRYITLAHLPARVGGQVRFVLAIPAGAVLVVFVRLTLGLRMLGPVRPVLIAIALQMIGIGPGLLCLGMIVAVVTLVRRVLVGRGLPYFARVAILLTVVAISVLTAVRLGDALDVKALELMSHLPIVVLCLAAESFSAALSAEGPRSALWRAGVTMLTAVAIALILSVPEVVQALQRCPELLLTEIGLIVLIACRLSVHLLEQLNPSPSGGPRNSWRAAARAETAAPVRAPAGAVTEPWPAEPEGARL